MKLKLRLIVPLLTHLPPHLPLKLLVQLLIALLRLLLRHRAPLTRHLSAATEAQACCEANRESMERMFQKSMSK